MDHVGPGWIKGSEPHDAVPRVPVRAQGLGPLILTRDLKSKVELKVRSVVFFG